MRDDLWLTTQVPPLQSSPDIKPRKNLGLHSGGCILVAGKGSDSGDGNNVDSLRAGGGVPALIAGFLA